MAMRAVQKSAVDVVRLVKTIEEVGPRNLSLVSRLTGIPVETVRYNVRVRLPRLGFRFRPVVDEGRLGLVKYFLRLRFYEDDEQDASELLNILARTAFLTYYASLAPHDGYVALASVPVEFEEEYQRLFEDLVELGVLASCELYPLDEVWKTSTDIRGFDLVTGRWNFNYTPANGGSIHRSIRLKRPDGDEEPIDKVDLLIIKELQKDALQPFTKMAKSLGISAPVISYHYKEHVVGRGLIQKYVLTWSNRGSFHEGEHLGLVLMCRGVDEDVLTRTNRVLQAIPFSSFEGLSLERAFYVFISTIPSSWLLRVLRLVKNEVRLCNVDLLFIEQSRHFTIPYEFYDDAMGWLFDRKKVLEALGRLADHAEYVT